MGHYKEIIFCFFLCLSLTLCDKGPQIKVEPTEYNLFIKTSEEDYKDSDKELRFTGTVNITFDLINPPASEFYFSVNIVPKTEIKNVTLYGVMGGGVHKEIHTNYTLNQTQDYLDIDCKKEIGEQYITLKLKIEFSNVYTNDMLGFYRSSYHTKDGKKRWILTTHFEPNYARRAFPCFDEPSLKAGFQVSIAVPKSMTDYNVLCNTPVLSNVSENLYKITKCHETEFRMSTYLVAFTISDFIQTEAIEFESNYPQKYPRLLATHGRKEIIDNGDAKLSQDAALEAVTLLGEYLEKGYAFEKIDQVGIPDFSAGAMENWGLILFREKALFYNEKRGSASTKQSNVLTITHELVHQWFGNLVSPELWNYIWLNEAFATYVSYVIASQIKNPKTADWDYMKQILVNEVQPRAFEVDGLTTARSLSQELHENIIHTAFDDIPYAKGASVLRMWDLSMKNDGFRKSLVDYIEKNAEKAVNPSALYASFKKITDMDKDFFQVWNEKPGYPVVEVKKNGSIYTLTQSRFLWAKPENSQENITYVLPISYTESNNLNFSTIPQYWLRGKVELNITSKWFIINNQQAGYYRVNYERENWLALADALNENEHSKIHELSRAQIINDVYSLARSVQKDYVDYSTAMTVTNYLKNETSYIVWKSALNAFEFVATKISQDEILYGQFKNYVLELLKPHFRELNKTTNNHLEKLMMAQISYWACSLEYEPCVESAKHVYKNASDYPDTESIILCTVSRTNNTIWNEVFEMYKAERVSSRKLMYLTALGCTIDTQTAEEYLNKTLREDSSIRKQDATFALASVYRGGPKNVEVALKFIENNFKAIAENYGGINPLGKAIMGIAARLHSKEDIARMEELAKKIKETDISIVPQESFENAINILKGNEKWMNERAKQIQNHLNSGSYVSVSIVLLTLCSIISRLF